MSGRTGETSSRDPAPGDLRGVQLFLNTRDIEAGTDLFDSPEATSSWLAGNGLTYESGTVQGDAQLSRLLQFREALRELLICRHDEAALDPESREILSRSVVGGAVSALLDDDGNVHLVSAASGNEGVMSTLMLIVHDAQARGEWSRLKVCSNDECRWAYWDSSRNLSGRWCTMALCGNQAKVRAHRQRQAAGERSPDRANHR
jgi:predicted RNA-binding Zn ribbon-like protein